MAPLLTVSCGAAHGSWSARDTAAQCQSQSGARGLTTAHAGPEHSTQCSARKRLHGATAAQGARASGTHDAGVRVDSKGESSPA